jgi:hypothetical protein
MQMFFFMSLTFAKPERQNKDTELNTKLRQTGKIGDDFYENPFL